MGSSFNVSNFDTVSRHKNGNEPQDDQSQAERGAAPPPEVVVNDVDFDPELEPTAREASNYTGSSMALTFRVRGVARVDSDHLNPNHHNDAAMGALRSPSGSLRHYADI